MGDTTRLQHLYRVFYEDLGLCGCGNPEDGIELVRDLLALAPFYEDERWRRVAARIGSGGATHLVLSAMTNADLIEHGTSIGGSWLSGKGQWVTAALARYPHSDALEEALDETGLPHEGAKCSAGCWSSP